MDLVSYIQNYLKPQSTALTVPQGTGVTTPGTSLVPNGGPPIIDGEWSEVPRQLTGSKLPVATSAAASGSLGRMGMANPLLAAVMGSIQPDIVRDPKLQDYLQQWRQANNPPQALAAEAARQQQQQQPAAPQAPQAPQSSGAIPWWANATGADFSGGNTPMPQARPAQAPQASMVNPNGSIAGAQGPTSVGGAPLVGQTGPLNIQSMAQQQGDQPQSQNGSALIQRMLQYLHNNAQLSDNPNTAAGSTFN